MELKSVRMMVLESRGMEVRSLVRSKIMERGRIFFRPMGFLGKNI